MTDKICLRCGNRQERDTKFCKNCESLLSDDNPSSDEMIICPECGSKHESSARFCRDCGSSFSSESVNDDNTIQCSHCGAVLNEEAFCPDCGNKTGIIICPNCGKKTVNDDFCSMCGCKLNHNITICQNCGKKIDEKSKNCPYCGLKKNRKSLFFALALSFIFPGLGHLYTNQYQKGILIIIGYAISYILSLIVIGGFFALLIWIYAMYDVFKSTKKINRGEFL